MSTVLRGHRRVPHTADVILEAWGSDRAGCFEEAIVALTGTFASADVTEPAPSFSVPPGPAEAQLLDLLDEVVFRIDTAPGIPVGASVREGRHGGLDVTLQLAKPHDVVSLGSVPKAVARSELTVTEEPGRVSCRFLVDV